ncbi:AAA family ATPase [Haloarcula sebkhae]|uniref:AAA family ATPase n=2 Tax=Haloarcula sebkhae TaxID=932660 RepID=A0ACC6VL86_9EURY|nr:AAA family ATPase [Haloarcula sebkhae]GGK83929.1 hypothetical protein GCM10009067_40120 [Haloarcula sebkhae]
MHISDVFTPGDTPDVTYVERNRGQKESELKLQINKKSYIASITGPSKSGKSALVDKVVEQNGGQVSEKITINGKQIRSERDLWSGILDGLNRPTEKSITTTDSESGEVTGSLGVNLGGFTADVGATTGESSSDEVSLIFQRSVLNYVNNQMDNSGNVLIFVDDAHYIPEDIHQSIAENIKMAFEYGLNFCFAYIPFRSDDLTKANNDLQTRTQHIELSDWSPGELKRIADIGFDELNISVSADLKEHFSRESVRSPYLMQELCYRFCAINDIYNKCENEVKFSPSERDIKEILRDTADSLKYPTAHGIISGDTRGRSDKQFNFVDGTEGDRYVALMRGVAANPPKSSFEMSEIKKRIDEQCETKGPEPGNIIQDVKRVSKWMNESDEDDLLFDYSDSKIEMIDPSLVFHLRWSRTTDFEPELSR